MMNLAVLSKAQIFQQEVLLLVNQELGTHIRRVKDQLSLEQKHLSKNLRKEENQLLLQRFLTLSKNHN